MLPQINTPQASSKIPDLMPISENKDKIYENFRIKRKQKTIVPQAGGFKAKPNYMSLTKS